ncbi:MAG: hypothetical protein KBC91_01795 [Candidatus Omnitrophica bacterium]|nr:hypothetical protein [Candidatus Omnitrophota bacterium]
MRPLVKTGIVAALFLVPLGIVCTRPISKHSELVPLPYKAHTAAVVPAVIPEEFGGASAFLVEQPPAPGVEPAGVVPKVESGNQLMNRFSFNYGALEVEDKDAVRLKGAKVGVDFHVDEQQSVGVETSQTIYDRQDAKAWGESGKDESTAGIKYKLIF